MGAGTFASSSVTKTETDASIPGSQSCIAIFVLTQAEEEDIRCD